VLVVLPVFPFGPIFGFTCLVVRPGCPLGVGRWCAFFDLKTLMTVIGAHSIALAQLTLRCDYQYVHLF
jgi:hypothetical protein